MTQFDRSPQQKHKIDHSRSKTAGHLMFNNKSC